MDRYSGGSRSVGDQKPTYRMGRRLVPVDWIFSEDQLKDSPSRRVGMSEKDELVLRRKGIKLILAIGHQLGLKVNPTSGTACVYFHRFYMLHSFSDFDWPLTALSCLFLAGKAEETPKKCRDICNLANKSHSELFTQCRNLIEDVMSMERVLLQTVKFDLQVDHPYKYLLDYANKLNNCHPKEVITEMVRCAWTLVNDSYATTLCLLWEPQIVAVSLFYLAIKLKEKDEINESRWWEEYVAELSVDKMDSICHAILDYYTAMKETENAV